MLRSTAHAHVDVLGVLLLGRRGERHLERAEHDVARHVLLAREHVHQHHQFTISCRHAFTATSQSSQFRHQLRPLHVVERQRHESALRAPGSPARLRRPSARRRTCAARSRPGCASAPRPSARQSARNPPLAQRPVEPRRGHFQPVVIDSLDLEYPGQLPADRRAILQPHPARLVDEQAQKPPAVRRLHIDQLVSHAVDHRLDDVFEAQTKNGPKPISDIPSLKLSEFSSISLTEQAVYGFAGSSRHFPAARSARQLDRAVAQPRETAHRVADGLEQAPHLAVSAFLQHHPVPAVDALALRGRSRCARSAPACRPAECLRAGAPAPPRVKLAAHARQVLALEPVARVHQPVGELARVGEEQQARSC